MILFSHWSEHTIVLVHTALNVSDYSNKAIPSCTSVSVPRDHISITATNEPWSSITRMFVHHFTHVACKLLSMLKLDLEVAKSMQAGTRNRSMTWSRKRKSYYSVAVHIHTHSLNMYTVSGSKVCTDQPVHETDADTYTIVNLLSLRSITLGNKLWYPQM